MEIWSFTQKRRDGSFEGFIYIKIQFHTQKEAAFLVSGTPMWKNEGKVFEKEKRFYIYHMGEPPCTAVIMTIGLRVCLFF